MGFFDHTLQDIDGELQSLAAYRGNGVLLVNVASRCGLTPQYRGLQELYVQYRARGLEIVGVPCNQFGGQEPGTSPEIKKFCSTRYDVTFPLMGKIEVNGAGRHPLYAWLTSQPTQPEGPGDIQWNFAKFLIDREGNVVGRFSPQTDPGDAQLRAAIEKALA